MAAPVMVGVCRVVDVDVVDVAGGFDCVGRRTRSLRGTAVRGMPAARSSSAATRHAPAACERSCMVAVRGGHRMTRSALAHGNREAIFCW